MKSSLLSLVTMQLKQFEAHGGECDEGSLLCRSA